MYIVLEIQVWDSVGTIINSYNDRNEAESRYHQILAAAAISEVPKHSAVLMDEMGETIKRDFYTHGVTE